MKALNDLQDEALRALAQIMPIDFYAACRARVFLQRIIAVVP